MHTNFLSCFPTSRHSLLLSAALVVTCATVGSAARAAPFNVTFEAPGVQSANQASLCATLGTGTCTIGVETFDARPAGAGQTFSTDYGTGGVISGTYSNVDIAPASVYGGAVDSSNAARDSNYAVTLASGGYQVSLVTTLPTGINYFGFWLSALDQGNTLTFYNGATQVYQFTPTDLINLVGACPNASNAYCGNPTLASQGQVSDQPFVFVNFFDQVGSFDRIVFAESPATGGYESDNHTVGYVTGNSGISVTPVPEPASLTLLAVGFASLALLRHRGRGLARTN